MKISKERLMEIIEEEVNKSLGSDTVSRSDRAKELRQKVKSTSSEQGVDAKERGIVQRIEQNLTKLADLTNIKSGATFALLNRLNSLMEKEIQKLEQGEQK
jgi:hypothetical protein